jgi:hypothetical protein
METFTDFFTDAVKEYAPLLQSTDVKRLVARTLLAWIEEGPETSFFDDAVFVRHAKLYDLMTKNKAGESKEFLWLKWARRCVCVREGVTSKLAGGGYDALRRGTASEHAMPRTLDETQTSTCYRWLGEDMLWNDLLPHQRRNPIYKARYDWQGNINLNNKQRSWIDSMLRRTLGDKTIAFFIWTHGLPAIFDASSDRNRKIKKAVLQSAVDKGMTWYASLIKSVIEYERETEAEKRHQREGPATKQAASPETNKETTKKKRKRTASA